MSRWLFVEGGQLRRKAQQLSFVFLPSLTHQLLSCHLCRALRSIFNYHVAEHDDDSSTGFIYPSQIYAIIKKLGRNDEERSRMQTALAAFQEQQHPQGRDPSSSTAARAAEALPAHSSSDSSTIATIQTTNKESKVQIVTDVPVGCITFDSFASIIDHGRQQTNTDDDNDSHLHFLYIVNEYQTRCDSEGNYLLAQDFMNHLVTLRKEEEDRVASIVNNELAKDLANLEEAHGKQLEEFTQSELEFHHTSTLSFACHSSQSPISLS